MLWWAWMGWACSMLHCIKSKCWKLIVIIEISLPQFRNCHSDKLLQPRKTVLFHVSDVMPYLPFTAAFPGVRHFNAPLPSITIWPHGLWGTKFVCFSMLLMVMLLTFAKGWVVWNDTWENDVTWKRTWFLTIVTSTNTHQYSFLKSMYQVAVACGWILQSCLDSPIQSKSTAYSCHIPWASGWMIL